MTEPVVSEVTPEIVESAISTPTLIDFSQLEKPNETVSEAEALLTIPDWVNDDLKPNMELSAEEKLNWYETNYPKAFTHLTDNEKFIEEYANAHKEILLSNEKDVEQLKAIDQALKNPELGSALIKFYFPDAMLNENLNPILNTQEVKSLIALATEKQFGKNYENLFDPDEANKKGTISYQVIQFQAQQKQAILEQQANLPTKEPVANVLSDEERKAIENKEYEQNFKQLPRNEFDKFMNEIKNKNLSLQDIYKIHNFELYEKQAYQKGIEDGKKLVGKELTQIQKETMKNNIFNTKKTEELTLQKGISQNEIYSRMMSTIKNNNKAYLN